ncbi:MAG: 2-dehydropantoate 2-reductase N-terminal domain-containing protein [Clostridia bacterium]|nr:2-dehydropantoate 2-reductase N-terminal domain-containing protein [Clostridia bacterium]
MKATVLGCGRWGSFVAWYLDLIKFDVTIWGRDGSANLNSLIKTRKNNFLTLNDNINISSDLDSVVSDCDIIFISIASQSLRSLVKTLKQLPINSNIPIVLCMKGIETKTGKRLSQIVSEFLDNPVAIWVGPGHVQDFVNGVPNCMVIDSENEELKYNLVNQLSSNLIRFYIGRDLLGNEIGAAAKNVIGIASGMLDALGYESLKGALMSRGTREVARLIDAMGGQAISVYGLSHLGDYQATLFSKHSNNRLFGETYVNKTVCDKLAEGFYTAEALVFLSKKYNIELPISCAVYDIITKSLDPKEVLSTLFMRSIKMEF